LPTATEKSQGTKKFIDSTTTIPKGYLFTTDNTGTLQRKDFELTNMDNVG